MMAVAASPPARVAVVTGASAGIGRATAVALAQTGAHVVLAARREGRLRELAAALSSLPGRRQVLVGDVGEAAFARRLVEQAVAEFGRLDVVINNAGIGHRSEVAAMSTADMDRVLQVNVHGLLYVTQAAVHQMRRQRSGHIVNVSSIAGHRPLPRSAVYCASKTAVNYLSRSLRMELADDNIRVTVVYPGLTATEFGRVRLGQPGLNRFGLPGIPPERVARAIIRALDSGRQEVYVTWADWLFVHLNRLFPRTIDWLVARAAHLA